MQLRAKGAGRRLDINRVVLRQKRSSESLGQSCATLKAICEGLQWTECHHPLLLGCACSTDLHLSRVQYLLELSSLVSQFSGFSFVLGSLPPRHP